MKMADQEYIMT